ncbi:MAG: CrcB family protein [Acidimicrobiia bacterium]
MAVLGGGLVGSAARSGIGEMFQPSGSFPVTTAAINVAGSLLLGFYLARHQRADVTRWSLQFWAIGAIGSFTTFSAFSVEVFHLVASGSMTVALSYVVASTLGGLTAALIGDRLGSVGR